MRKRHPISWGVRSLLMGGQACVLYGGAEFSRDTDLVIVSDVANLDRLRAALSELDAHPIAVPPFEQRFLDEGLDFPARPGVGDRSAGTDVAVPGLGPGRLDADRHDHLPSMSMPRQHPALPLLSSGA